MKTLISLFNTWLRGKYHPAVAALSPRQLAVVVVKLPSHDSLPPDLCFKLTSKSCRHSSRKNVQTRPRSGLSEYLSLPLCVREKEIVIHCLQTQFVNSVICFLLVWSSVPADWLISQLRTSSFFLSLVVYLSLSLLVSLSLIFLHVLTHTHTSFSLRSA